MKMATALVSLAAALAIAPLSVHARSGNGAAQGGAMNSQDTGADSGAAEDDYDRLDGKGASGRKVNVVEWEGNLEIHVYPAGSLKGLALKLDKRNKDKPVMVIGYRFDTAPSKQLIRRAILGIELREGFKAYRDPSADGYDKIIVSNNGLSGDMIAYKLDPEPTQLYPDGHPALASGKDPGAKPVGDDEEKRTPASKPAEVDDNGTIEPFFMKK